MAVWAALHARSCSPRRRRRSTRRSSRRSAGRRRGDQRHEHRHQPAAYAAQQQFATTAAKRQAATTATHADMSSPPSSITGPGSRRRHPPRIGDDHIRTGPLLSASAHAGALWRARQGRADSRRSSMPHHWVHGRSYRRRRAGMFEVSRPRRRRRRPPPGRYASKVELRPWVADGPGVSTCRRSTWWSRTARCGGPCSRRSVRRGGARDPDAHRRRRLARGQGPRDIIVCNARGVFDMPLAEWVVGAILAMQRGFVPRAMRRRAAHGPRPGDRAAGRRVVILGPDRSAPRSRNDFVRSASSWSGSAAPPATASAACPSSTSSSRRPRSS